MTLPKNLSPARLTPGLAEATILYRVEWGPGCFGHFRWYEDAEKRAEKASRDHGEAVMGEYHHGPVGWHELVHIVRFRDGKLAQPVKRQRRKGGGRGA